MNKYSSYSADQLEELFSNYLIDSWSYSKVGTFARNEKAFEMLYIYCEKERRSVSSIAGNAYHEALKAYFENWTAVIGSNQNIVSMTELAYQYIDEIPANDWRLSDKFPTVDAAREEATKLATALITNFLAEADIYTHDLAKVLSVEVKESAWVVCNGVDIPLPLHYIADLVAETFDGKTIVIDHKSKSAYTPADEIALTHGQQAITYVLGYEATNPGSKVDEVWFVENKASKNRDKSAQLRKHVITMDDDTRKLYEYYLYEPLKRMLSAVSNPDYDYLINNTDNLTDKAALYEFSARTLIAEVDDFNIPDGKKEAIARRLRKIKDSSMAMISPKVISTFRKNAASFITYDYTNSNMTNTEKIEHAFRSFGKQVQVAYEIEGFSCNTYLCQVAAGVQLGSLKSYVKDIAYALDVPTVRIAQDLVMYDGKSYLSIEVNKKNTETLLWDNYYAHDKVIPVGLDNFRQPVEWNLDNHSTPHVLVCGATGSGKSVMVLSSIRYAQYIGVQDIIILDPKYEFCDIEGDSNCEIRVYNDIRDIETALEGMVATMNERVRNKEKKLTLVVFDEFADAQDQSKELHRKDKDYPTMPMEVSFKMLLQKGRSCGFRFLAATQRADTKTISGSTKVNFPVQICFRVPKAIDSKVVIDEEGANGLAGKGDGLMKSPEYLDQLVRFQGFYWGE